MAGFIRGAVWLISFILLFFAVAPALLAQNTNPNYDAALAAKLGADDYGMKMYTLVILKTGTNNSSNSELRQLAFAGHLSNINRLVSENTLIVAGPFAKNDDDFRGLFILDISDLAAAEKLLQTDPAIAQGYLQAELYPWYGSAALAEYLPAADKVWQSKP